MFVSLYQLWSIEQSMLVVWKLHNVYIYAYVSVQLRLGYALKVLFFAANEMFIIF